MSSINLLYIDLFCGAGGTSTGVESARINDEQCAKVIACVNHDANAIASHAANHPDALHFTEDIRTLELSPLIEHLAKCKAQYQGAAVVLWASLECTNFSKAKGGQPRDADSRTLAEHLFRYIEAINPDYIQIENVEEFMSWGPMDENGRPISMHKGEDYTRWIRSVKSYGYNFDHRILNAADFGAYTSRKRFFGIFGKKGLPIVFPEPTHCKEGKQDMFGSILRWKPVKDVLDLEDEGTSIFTRKKPLSENTLERIYAGLIKFVAGGKDKWLLKYNSINGKTGKHIPPGIDKPCPTVPTKDRFNYVNPKFLCSYNFNDAGKDINAPCPTLLTKDRFSLISPFFMNYYSGGGQYSDINQPSPTILANPKQRLISCQFMDQQFGQSKPAGVNQPLGALTSNPKYNLVSCRPWVMNTNFGNIGSRIEEPAPVITANRKWHYLMNPQFVSPGNSVNDPCFTLIARMDKRPPYLISLNTVFSSETPPPDFVKIDAYGNVVIEVFEDDSPMTKNIKEFMAIYQIVDILMRMLKVLELKLIMGFPEDYMLIGTQADQKKFIGNAVEVNMARVLCECISTKLRELGKITA